MEKEYTVTIPLDEYKDLVQTQKELDSLILFIFGNTKYNNILDKLDIDYLKLEGYLKTIFSYYYYKKFNDLKKEKFDE